MKPGKIVAGRLKAVVGPPEQSPRRAAKVGGQAPEWIQIFPNGEYSYDWEGKTETAICDTESRATIIASFTERGNDLVIDYEHQTLDGDQAPAAGWIKELEDRGPDGLWARCEWTEKAKEYLLSGEYRYDSPVFTVDSETRRIVALHHLALTNWPASHNRTALTEQIAAKVRARVEKRNATAREGVGMNAIAERLKWWLNLPTTTTNNELRTHLQKVMDSIPADDQLAYSKAEGEIDGAATIAAALGIQLGEPALADPAEVVASKAVLEELDLPEGATLAEVHAKIGELMTPAIDPAEHQRIVAELKTAKEKIDEITTVSEDDKLNQMVARYRAKITPAKEKWFRALAKKHGLDHAEDVAKNMKDEMPDSSPADAAPVHVVETTDVAATRRVRDREMPVDPDSAMRAAKVRAIQKEKSELTYRQASEELTRREASAS